MVERQLDTMSNGTVPYVNGHSSWQERHQLASHFIGGNAYAQAPAGPVKDWVARNDGHSVITSVSLETA